MRKTMTTVLLALACMMTTMPRGVAGDGCTSPTLARQPGQEIKIEALSCWPLFGMEHHTAHRADAATTGSTVTQPVLESGRFTLLWPLMTASIDEPGPKYVGILHVPFYRHIYYKSAADREKSFHETPLVCLTDTLEEPSGYKESNIARVLWFSLIHAAESKDYRRAELLKNPLGKVWMTEVHTDGGGTARLMDFRLAKILSHTHAPGKDRVTLAGILGGALLHKNAEGEQACFKLLTSSTKADVPFLFELFSTRRGPDQARGITILKLPLIGPLYRRDTSATTHETQVLLFKSGSRREKM
jgi:hypothetical protein